MSLPEALALVSVRRTFGRTVALDGASCLIRAGSVHALLGENGAGKTTLMRIAFGLVQPEAGEVRLHGERVSFRSSRDAIARGLGMVHQHFMLVPAMTVAENVALGGRGRMDHRAVTERIRRIGKESGLTLDPDARVADLSVGDQQRLEIVKALAHDARILILDEPTAVLPPVEAGELMHWLRRFADGGGTAVLITHKLRDAFAVADDITVLRRGRTVLAGSQQTLSEGQVIAALAGDAPLDAARVPRHDTVNEGAPVLALDHVDYMDARGIMRLRDVTLSVRAGEVLGVLGVEGAGQRELLRLLAGRLLPARGRVMRPTRVGFIPEDRLHDALIPSLSLTENLLLAEVGQMRGFVDSRKAAVRTQEVIDRFDVRAEGPEAAAADLSGGNQQKFVVGRERMLSGDALVAENPTRGLDLVAAARVLEELTTPPQGTRPAVVIHSSDIDEVLTVATRVVVCFNGTVREIPWPADAEDRAPFTRAMTGTG
jgi:general nucleoside transport system ATP-binding protein